ncbi:MAG: VCBS repeat-containing protein [Flavobacteriales bacterium]|nr:VCBS repeat-containing protein [Flavobacteriales bacterium]
MSLLLTGVEKVGAQFTEISGLAGITVPDQQMHAGVSFYDFNKDGWDDLTLGITLDSVYFYINQGNGSFQLQRTIPNESFSKAPVWADYDNDGDADFILSREYGSCRLFRNDDGIQFTEVTENLPQFAPEAMCESIAWGDYDRDGWLDLYVGNWNQSGDITNWLFRNNQDGTFSDVSAEAGVGNGMKSTLAALFIDYNFDLWPDIFVANDKDMGNALYHNNGDGTFTDITAATNAGQLMNSMCASASDFDNDGDWDIYVSNDFEGNVLLRFDGTSFTDIAPASGTETINDCWAGLWIDYDNNLWDDLYVATASFVNNNRDYFYVNNGDLTFTQAQTPLQLQAFDLYSYSSAKADFDNDYDWDIVMYYHDPSDLSLFRNDSPDIGNALKLTLEGTVSNRDGVGARIDYWIGDVHKMTATFCGESYLSQDSQHELLAMGTSEVVDSLMISWPSGWVDTYYEWQAFNHYSVVEGATFQPSIIDEYVMCGSAPVVLDGGAFESWSWSTGDTSRYVEALLPGEYQVEVTNALGISAHVSIYVEGLLNDAQIVVVPPSCNGYPDGHIEIMQGEAMIDSVAWTNGTSEFVLDQIGAGPYAYTIYYQNGCVQSEEKVVLDPLPLSFEIWPTLICPGTAPAVEVNLGGGTGPLEIDFGGLNPESASPGEYDIFISDSLNCELSTTISILEYDAITIEGTVVQADGGENGSISLVVSGGMPPYEFLWDTGETGPEANELGQGEYTCVVTDTTGCMSEVTFSIIDLLVSDPTKINEGIYPNPCKDYFFIPHTGCAELHDAAGNIVLRQDVDDFNRRLDVSQLDPGLYLLTVNQLSVKLVVE